MKTLRLCHRFGKGPQATITTLPIELITLIEGHLVRLERKNTLKAWSKDLRCFQQRCVPADHVSKKDMKDRRKEVITGTLPFPSELAPDASVEEQVNFHLSVDLFDEWAPVHYDRCVSWQLRTGRTGCARRGFFTKHRELFTKHFGLTTWIAHVRLPHYEPDSVWEAVDVFAAEKTIAYLKLPEAQGIFRHWDLKKVHEKDDYMIESGYGVPVAIPGPLSAESRAKFKRTMKILDLKPQRHEHQKDMMLAADEKSRKKAKKQRRAWPQLTMLVNSTARFDDIN